MFSNKDLKNLIVPLFLEQLLMALVGIADVFVIGFVGEAAVSGVPPVNSFNTMFINLFTTLASWWCGSDQPVYRKERREACRRGGNTNSDSVCSFFCSDICSDSDL